MTFATISDRKKITHACLLKGDVLKNEDYDLKYCAENNTVHNARCNNLLHYFETLLYDRNPTDNENLVYCYIKLCMLIKLVVHNVTEN